MTAKDFSHITEMENILNAHDEKLKELAELINFFHQQRDNYLKLMAYYGSEQYRNDLELDEQNLIPNNIPRGVLGEDYIWNMMCDYQEIGEELIHLGQLMKQNDTEE